MTKIKSVKIEELFGCFNHHVEFSQDEGITILLGQNGIGKTAILRILHMLFNHQLCNLVQIPFRKATIDFDDNSCLYIDLYTGDPDNVVDYSFSHGNDFFDGPITSSEISNRVKEALRGLRNYTSENFKNDEDVWIDRKSGEQMTAEELVWKCKKDNPNILDASYNVYPFWLETIISQISVYFIQTQRLQEQVSSVIPGRVISRNIVEYQSSLNIISREMKERLLGYQRNYGQKSTELDQSYPYRIMEKLNNLSFTKAELDNLNESLDELQQRRARLIGAGLLNKMDKQMSGISFTTKSPYVLKAVSIFISDQKEKFALFDDELKRIELFRELVNKRLLRKKVIVDVMYGIMVESTETGKEIPLTRLSSGEQHLLILYYDMIFRYNEESLLLIDEPEISLHVSWQKRFIPELKKIIKLNKMNVLIATHSPTLIGKYWDLTRELDRDIENN